MAVFLTRKLGDGRYVAKGTDKTALGYVRRRRIELRLLLVGILWRMVTGRLRVESRLLRDFSVSDGEDSVLAVIVQ
ncbi:MAG: hypothetical protein R3F23_09490 [Verrucomicrobiia bacterium]